jgi:ribosomal protein S18 acetylase RimI-like enzyme
MAEPWRPELDALTRDAHNDAFRDHWGSDPLSDGRWRHFVAGMPGFRAESSWLAVTRRGTGGTTPADVAGYTLTTVNDVDGERVGWLGTIGVRRAWRHQGVASALITRSLESFRSLGAARAGLDVDAENPTGAVRVYESLGFTATEESVIYSKPLEP